MSQRQIEELRRTISTMRRREASNSPEFNRYIRLVQRMGRDPEAEERQRLERRLEAFARIWEQQRAYEAYSMDNLLFVTIPPSDDADDIIRHYRDLEIDRIAQLNHPHPTVPSEYMPITAEDGLPLFTKNEIRLRKTKLENKWGTYGSRDFNDVEWYQGTTDDRDRQAIAANWNSETINAMEAFRSRYQNSVLPGFWIHHVSPARISTIPLGRRGRVFSNLGPRLEAYLESLNYQTIWNDQTYRCEECSLAIQDDHYRDRYFYLSPDGMYCRPCLEADPDPYIEFLKSRPDNESAEEDFIDLQGNDFEEVARHISRIDRSRYNDFMHQAMRGSYLFEHQSGAQFKLWVDSDALIDWITWEIDNEIEAEADTELDEPEKEEVAKRYIQDSIYGSPDLRTLLEERGVRFIDEWD